MKLKIWLLALALFLVVAFSGTTYGIPAVASQSAVSVAEDIPYAQDISSNTPLVVSGRTLDWITIKRIEPKFVNGNLNLGHYWIEISSFPGMSVAKSYGWWPPGLINRGNQLDPHHGDTADIRFNPILTNSLTDRQVFERINNFANDYEGNWQLLINDCHTFQRELMESVGLKEPEDLPSWSETSPSDDNSEVGQDVGQSAVESGPSSIQSSSIQQESTGTGMSNEEVGQQVSETVGSIFEAGAAGMIDHPDASIEETIQSFQDMIPTHN